MQYERCGVGAAKPNRVQKEGKREQRRIIHFRSLCALTYDRVIKKARYKERRQRISKKKKHPEQGGRDEVTERARVTAGGRERGS